MRERISVLILTKNEEAVIERAIRSAWWADEVLVLDSESTDQTREIAQRMGARVYIQPWLGWLGQKARGLELATHDWIFSLDADEVVSPQLGQSIMAVLESRPDPANGYVVDRREEFLGEFMTNMRRKAKRESFVRLFNKTMSRWDPDLIVHEEVRCPGQLILLEGDLLHWRNYTIGKQVDTINRNADLEARMLTRTRRGGHPILIALKPLLRFGWIYLICGNWRLGTRGLIWAGVHSCGEFLRQAKAWEARNIKPVPNPPPELYGIPAQNVSSGSMENATTSTSKI